MVLKMETMKEHGLLFQPDMARANVAGLKTMTRRKVKPRHAYLFDCAAQAGEISFAFTEGRQLENGDATYILDFCPWQVGDMIYQKETHCDPGLMEDQKADIREGLVTLKDCGFLYRADNENIRPALDGWTASIFMPKWAARFWADIVSIKVERVRDISAEDCIKEGIQERHGGFMVGYTLPEYGPQPVGIVHKTPVAAYKELYNGINGPGSFDRDWGWVIEYRRV